jgi:RHS repeat-associated protein
VVQAREGEPERAKSPLLGRLAVAGPRHVSIDSNGNLTIKVDGGVTWTYVWDAENRLKWVCNTTPCTEAGAVAAFTYDPLGRRVEKVAGGVTTAYAYDGANVLREIGGTTTLKYTHAGEYIDEPLAQEDGTGTSTFFHADGLGSVVRTTSIAGAVLTTRRYEVFGTPELGAANGYSYTGREWDSETGLYYYRARYYDAEIGRFISEDPIGLSGGVNRYAYAEGNPLKYRDPFGLDSITIGPITIPLPWTRGDRDPAINEGEDAHEACHRRDWRADYPGWEKEQRGFAEEIPILERRLKELQRMAGDPKTKKAIQEVQEALDTARSMQDDWVAREYWNRNNRWRPWNKVPNPVPTPAPTPAPRP